MKHLILRSAVLMVSFGGLCSAQTTITPIYVQPPQFQVPAPTPAPTPVQVPVTVPATTPLPLPLPTPTPVTNPATPITMPTVIEVTPGTLPLPVPTTPALPTPIPTPEVTTTTITTTPVPATSVTTVPTPVMQVTTTPTPTAPTQPTFTFGSTAPGTTPSLQQTTSVTLTPAQPPEKFLLWGGTGLNTATGGINFGVSYPVMQVKGLNLLARGTGELGVVSSSAPRFSLRADALASYPLGSNAVYGGPGMVAGVGAGDQSSLYGLGLTVGYRANFSPKLGGFVEGQLNRYWNSTGAQVAPGLRTGITFRF